jgi:3-deoxy-D-manno-octulosonic-acid transferase
VLKCFTHFFVQNEISRELLAKIGIHDVTIVGDTRFDRVLQIKEQTKRLPIVEAFRSSAPTMVAGSSWLPDEEIFVRYFNEHREWKLIIAPHVINEDHINQILAMTDRKVVRYTQTTPEEAAQADTLIIDCYGLLSSIYNYGDVANIGGGFGVGIHNLLEAAVWDMPVIFGPNNQRFQEAQELKAVGGGFEIQSYDDFERLMAQFANADYLQSCGTKAGDYVKSRAGATNLIFSAVGL